MDSTSLGTHITYHTQHKVPFSTTLSLSWPLPLTAIQGGHRKAQPIEPSNILTSIELIKQSYLWLFKYSNFSLNFLTFVPTNFPMDLNFQAQESWFCNGLLGNKLAQIHPKYVIYESPIEFHYSREFLGRFDTMKIGFFPSYHS